MKATIRPSISVFLAVFLYGSYALSAFAQSGVSSIAVGGASYFSIDLMARQRGLQFQWDPILKNAVVTSSSGFMKLLVDSEFILNDDRVVKLQDKVRYLQGEVMAPLSAAPYFDQMTLSASKASLFTRPHSVKKVVIDAGHGGYDFGAVGLSGIQEKEVVLQIAKKIAAEMIKMGMDVTMTRSSDVFVPLPGRSKTANEKQADLFISIHANASFSRSLNGFEVYYLSPAADDMSVALENAENAGSFGTAQISKPTKGVKAIYLDLEASENRKASMHAAKDIVSAVQRSVVIAARRIKPAQFHVLKWTACPSILIETGYVTNLEDEKRLSDPVYQEQLARAIARGFLNYKIEFERTDGFSQ